MKVFVVVSSLLAIASAAPSLLAPTFYAAAPATTIIAAAPAELVSQYHAQDDFGQYSYGYNGGLSAKAESKSIDGITRGSYSYVDAENKLQHVAYTADSLNGFRVEASNLPVAPVETRTAPEPVQDTPEVAQAKVEHMAAIEEAKVRNAEADKADEAEIVAAAPVAAIAPITTYTAAVAPAPIAIAPVAPATYTPGSGFAYSTSSLALKKIEQPLAISTYAAAPAVSYEVKAPASFAYSTYAHAAPATFAANIPTAYSYGVPAPATYATYGYAAPAPHFYAATPAVAAPIAIAARSLPVEIAALPEPVQDTPEVAKAKEEHLAAVAEAKARNLQ